VIVADTVKNRGVSFMEARGLPLGELYRFHSAAPSLAQYAAALSELHARCSAAFARSMLRCIADSDPRYAARLEPLAAIGG